MNVEGALRTKNTATLTRFVKRDASSDIMQFWQHFQVFMKVPVSKNQKTEKTAENNTAYHHFIKIRLPENMSEKDVGQKFPYDKTGSLLGKLVENNEARKVKCICGGNWKTVSVNQVELIGGLKQESEAWQKIIRRLVVCESADNNATGGSRLSCTTVS
ncbi:hypothetical protein T01_10600 [Trichinella spiralis]|uniref:Uncharacterized protein n=1 Tax=Trichinella spiralis TaxID=6334 RepID=A0A0V1ANQ6_TRISP|nr:hypothetical protein T01_10600 [Trichinella spiralis]